MLKWGGSGAGIIALLAGKGAHSQTWRDYMHIQNISANQYTGNRKHPILVMRKADQPRHRR